MSLRFAVRVIDKEMRRDLRFVRNKVQKIAHSRAMNYANKRVRTRIIRGAQAALGLKKQAALRRQIRIPKKFRATFKKPDAGGVYGAFVPRSFHAEGEPYIFLNRKPVAGATISLPFVAKMKSGHSGIFVRVLNHPKRRREQRPGLRPPRGKGQERKTTVLPISELFTNALERIVPVAKEAARFGYGEYAKEFNRQIGLLLRSRKGA